MLKIMKRYKSMSTVVKATFWFMICGILQRGISMLTTPIFTRMLTVEHYGEYSLYNSWLSVFTIFCTFRLEKAVFNKGMTKFSNEKDIYTASMQSTTSIFTLIMLCVYLLFRNQINQLTELSTFLMCMMFLELLFHPAMSFYNIRKRYDYKYKSVVLVTLLYSVLNAILGCVVVYISPQTTKGTARILSCVVVAVTFGLVLYLYNFQKSHFTISWQHIKFAVSFNAPLIPHYFSSYILEQSDRLMIQKLCGVAQVGIYSVAYSAGLIMKLVTDSLHSAITPWQYKKMQQKKYNEINEMFFPLMMLVVATLIIFIAFVPEVIYLLAGAKYYEAMYVLPPISASVFFIMLYGMFSNGEFYFDANKFPAIMTAIGAVLNVILNLMFIPMFGYVAAAYTTLVCYTVFAYAHFFYANAVARKKENVQLFSTKQIIWPTILVYAGVVVFSFCYGNWIVRYLFIVVIGIVLLINRRTILQIFLEVKRK